VALSNPTIVIDGAHSRIVADLSQNTNGNGFSPVPGPWQTTQRVDLADLDLSGIDPSYGSGSVTWSAIPAKLSPDAAPFGNLAEGTALDPITVSLETE
jgi:hypothetical protein